MVNMVDQHLDVSFLCRQMDTEGNKVAPLYQRVLSALIIDDETDEETVGGGNMSFLRERGGSPGVTCFSQDIENQSKTGTEYEFKSCMFSCNGNPTFTSGTNTHDQELDFLQARQGPLQPETGRLPIVSENGSGGLLSMHRISCSSSFNHFEQMSMEDKLLLELQSVGIYPEPVVYFYLYKLYKANGLHSLFIWEVFCMFQQFSSPSASLFFVSLLYMHTSHEIGVSEI